MAGYMSPITTMLQFFSDQGIVGNGYKVYVYSAGTTTPITTYTDSTLGTPNSNPITLETNGRLPAAVWVAAGTRHKMVLKTAAGATVPNGTIDNLLPINELQYPRTADEVTASVVPTNYAYEPGDVRRYGAVGDGTTSDQTAVANALLANKRVIFPPSSGGYKITAALAPTANSTLIGCGYSSRIIQSTTTAHGFSVTTDNVVLDGLWVVGTNTDTYQAVNGSSADNLTVRNCTWQSWVYGVTLDGCNDYNITDNLLYGGQWQSAENGHDIRVYTNGSTSRGGKIAGNRCYGNSTLGIYVDALATDSDIIIADNFIQPRQSDGLTVVADGSNRRRNGIAVSYNGGNDSRVIVRGNQVRDVSYTGIYQGGAVVQNGPVIIEGNIVYRCGWGTLYPSDATLRAGIHCLSGGDDIIANNIVTDCSTTGIKWSQAFNKASNSGRPQIINNTVADTLSGYGIWVTEKPFGISIKGNKVLRSGNHNIYFTSQNSAANIGSCEIDGNYVEKTGVYCGILADGVYSTTYQISVRNNTVLGDDDATADTFNVGIYCRGDVMIQGNRVQDCRYGIYREDTTTAREITWLCPDNTIVSCTVGIYGGTTGDGTRVVQNNTFVSCGTNVNNCREGWVSGGVIYTQATAVPTTGTWAIGDTVRKSNSAVGSPVGWICTTAGASGVFAFTALPNL